MSSSDLSSLWLAKAVGAIAGSAISLAYVLPHGMRDAAIRFLSGVAGGLVFGTPIGVHIAKQMQIDDLLSDAEITVMGAGVASLGLWWAIGIALRWGDRRPPRDHKDETEKSEP